MTHRERFNRVMHFQEVDRVPNEEFGYWTETLERWRSEGMPEEADEELYFGLDVRRERRLLPINNSGAIPESGCRVVSLGDLEKIKPHFDPHSPERYPDNWSDLTAQYQERDYPLGLNMTGFFGLPRAWMGLANCCVGYYENPELMHALGDFWADFLIESSRKAFAEIEIDFVQVWEDMAYNHGSLISPKCFREFMTPYYRRVTDFIRSQGADVILCDTDGDVNDMVELFVEAGVNGLYPLEVVAGTDSYAIREKYPDLLLMGGVDKIEISKGPDAIDREVDRIAPLLEKGGFIPFIDHRVPSDITLANYKYYMFRKREVLGGDLLPPQCDLTQSRAEALKPAKPWTYKPQGVGPSLG
ncbi:MAG: hypothetical protein HY318_00785 [Armatimonadetes bacterium]|nr:hypothetical protein [Armatimonadota bacterium]